LDHSFGNIYIHIPKKLLLFKLQMASGMHMRRSIARNSRSVAAVAMEEGW
jgi:hypothetical protein